LELGPAGPDLHREIGRRILELNAVSQFDHLVLVGELAEFIAEAVAAGSPGIRMTLLAGVEAESGARVAEVLRPGDAVLIKGSRGVGLERLLPMMEKPQRNGPGPIEVATTGKPGFGAKAAVR
jgi:UDP-N-acetylmuramyl pentapeptide synthase